MAIVARCRNAVHEGSHAVTAWLLDVPVYAVSLEPAHVEHKHRKKDPLATAVIAYAGGLVEERVLGAAERVSQVDFDNAREAIVEFVDRQTADRVRAAVRRVRRANAGYVSGEELRRLEQQERKRIRGQALARIYRYVDEQVEAIVSMDGFEELVDDVARALEREGRLSRTQLEKIIEGPPSRRQLRKKSREKRTPATFAERVAVEGERVTKMMAAARAREQRTVSSSAITTTGSDLDAVFARPEVRRTLDRITDPAERDRVREKLRERVEATQRRTGVVYVPESLTVLGRSYRFPEVTW